MKSGFNFIKTTLLGGAVVLIPTILVVALLAKAFVTVHGIIAPLAEHLPEHFRFPGVIAALLLLLVSFAAGLLMRTGLGRGAGSVFEKTILERVPGYTLLRSLTRQAAGVAGETKFAAALVVIEEALVPAFVVEQHPDGQCTVFVPSAPTPAVGAIYILPKARVHLLNVPFTHAVKCITNWGTGSGELLKAMNKVEPRPDKR